KRVRVRRLEKGLSQTQLATKIGVTFQQVQKYENGVNRISASRLQRIAEILNVPITFFFDVTPARSGGAPFAYLQTEGSLKLMRAYAEIKDAKVRYVLVEIAQRLARESKSASKQAPSKARRLKQSASSRSRR